MIAVADFAFLGSAVVFVHSVRGWMSAVCIEAILRFIDGDELLGLVTEGRECGGEKFLLAADDGGITPQALGRFVL